MWDKLTVGQFIQLYDIETNTNFNVIEKQQKVLSILENTTEDVYDNIKYRDLIDKYNKAIQFLNNIPETKPKDYIYVGEKKYKFCYELSEITAGQYIDIGAFSNNITQINKISACFFLPMSGDRYMEYGKIPHDVVANDLLDANFLDVYGCMLFFYQLFKELITNTLTYSSLTEEARQTLIRLWNDGVGYTIQNK